MTSRVEFRHRSVVDPQTRQEREEVVVIRDGRVVATILRGHPLWRLLSLSPREAAWMLDNYSEVMKLKPEIRQILEAVIDYQGGSPAAEAR